LPCHATSLS
jgi:hypothetical protein